VKRIGVLAVQGGFDSHLRALEAAGYTAVTVREARDLDWLDGLVLPGGESTTQWKLIVRHGLATALAAFVNSKKPILATCAGLILAARAVRNPEQPSFGWLDVSVARNAWGRQVDSFEAPLDGGGDPMVFIRAPRIEAVGDGVEVLATYRGEPVLVRQGSIVGAVFHPELGPAAAYARLFPWSAPS
jgi:5'-phosphate synthase pdxT subunit